MLMCLNRRTGMAARLVLFHHAGGSALSFAHWRDTDLGGEVFVVELPGRAGQRPGAPMARVGDAIRAIDGALQTLPPKLTVLFGHSMGAMLAFALASTPGMGARHAIAHVIVSGHDWPPGRFLNRTAEARSDADIVDALCRIGGPNATLLGNAELQRLVVPVIRADVALLESYDRSQSASVACPLSAWCGDADPVVSPRQMAGWAAGAEGHFSTRVFPGGHFYFQEKGAEVAAALRAVLAGPGADG